jgi:NADH dehydrogenase
MILVSGGTGFIGSAVVAELLRRGESVAVLGRDAAKIRRRFGDGVEARAGDVREPAALPQAMTGIDVVINAVQFSNYPMENKGKRNTFEAVDYEGTRNQVDAAKQAGVKRFVYVSGVGVGPEAQKHWFLLKWRAEEYLRGSGLEYAIVRPTWVFGPEDDSLNRLLRFGRFLPFIPMFGNGRQAMQPVFIDDVAQAVADAALRPEAANQLIEIGGPEIMTMDAVLKAGLQASGKRRFILYQPVALGKLLGSVAGLLPRAPLTADAVDFVTEPAVADNKNLERLFAPKLTRLEDGLGTYMGRRGDVGS